MCKKLKQVKRYSELFKRTRVQEYESGSYTVLNLSRMYGFSEQVMYTWIHKYSRLAKKNIVIVEDHKSASEKLKLYEVKIKDLECIVGKKQIELDYLHKLIELVEQELGIDIKKNLDTPHLNSSLKTKKK